MSFLLETKKTHTDLTIRTCNFLLLKIKYGTFSYLMLFLFVIGPIIIQTNNAYAESSRKIFFVQQYEQFPGQEVEGFCNLRIDDDGNLHWRIKVTGLNPGTTGHFDLGHWGGEKEVQYTADSSGKADSDDQTVLKKNVPPSLLLQFAKCKVHTSDSIPSLDPVIAIGVTENPKTEDNENKKPVPSDEISFLSYSWNQFVGIFTSIIPQDNEKPNANSLVENNSSNQSESNRGFDIVAMINSIFGNKSQKNSSDHQNENLIEPNPNSEDIKNEKSVYSSPNIKPNTTVKEESNGKENGKNLNDKGSSSSSSNDKGSSSSSPNDKGSTNKNANNQGR